MKTDDTTLENKFKRLHDVKGGPSFNNEDSNKNKTKNERI